MTISPGLTSPIEAVNECVSLVIVPLLVATVSTSMYVGNESTTILSLVGAVPVFPILIVNVKLSFTLACEGATDIESDGPGINVPVGVEVGVIVAVGWVPVTVGVAVEVPVAVAVEVLVGVPIAVEVSVGVSVGVAVVVMVPVMTGVDVSVGVEVTVSVSMIDCLI